MQNLKVIMKDGTEFTLKNSEGFGQIDYVENFKKNYLELYENKTHKEQEEKYEDNHTLPALLLINPIPSVAYVFDTDNVTMDVSKKKPAGINFPNIGFTVLPGIPDKLKELIEMLDTDKQTEGSETAPEAGQ